MLAVLPGTATIALLPHDSQLLGWLYPHLSHAATSPAEQGAAASWGYCFSGLRFVAGLQRDSIAALIVATPDWAQPPGGGRRTGRRSARGTTTARRRRGPQPDNRTVPRLPGLSHGISELAAGQPSPAQALSRW